MIIFYYTFIYIYNMVISISNMICLLKINNCCIYYKLVINNCNIDIIKLNRYNITRCYSYSRISQYSRSTVTTYTDKNRFLV